MLLIAILVKPFQLVSQSFYFGPVLLSKIYHHNAYGNFSDYDFSLFGASYSAESPLFHTSSTINYGLNAGIRWKSIHLETAGCTDQVASVVRIGIGLHQTQKTIEYLRQLRTYRLHLNFGIKCLGFGAMTKNGKEDHEVWCTLGGDLVFKRDNPDDFQASKDSITMANYNFVIINNSYLGIGKYRAMINLGLKYRWNFSKRNSICFSMYYSYSDNRLGGGLYSEILIKQTSPSSRANVYWFPSSGFSAMYFGLMWEYAL